jgi:hypothetical protein
MMPDDDGAKLMMVIAFFVAVIIAANVVAGSICRSKALGSGLNGEQTQQACK